VDGRERYRAHAHGQAQRGKRTNDAEHGPGTSGVPARLHRADAPIIDQ
jgi:hypothetical protein